MSRALLRKAVADLRSHRLQGLLIVLIIAGATATLLLAVTVQRLTAAPYDRLFRETHGAHVWFASSDPGVDLAAIGALDGVTETAGPHPVAYPVVEHRLGGPGAGLAPMTFGVQLVGLPAEPPVVGRPWVTVGRWLAAGADDEIVLHPDLVRFLGTGVGDQLDLRGADGTVAAFRVVGLALTSGTLSNTIAWALPTALPRVEPRPENRGAIYGVRLDNAEASRAFGARAFALFPDGAIDAGTDWHDIRTAATADTEIPVVLLTVFSLFALVAAGFVIANAIGGRVLAQYRDIGLLKAIGFTPLHVALLFVVELLALGLVGVVIGLGIGTALTPLFRRDIADVLATVPVATYDPLRLLVVAAAVEGAVALFALLPAWRGGRISTVRAINIGFARIQTRPSLMARVAARLRLPAPVVLGVKDVFARPLRAGLTVAALALTVVTVTFTMGMEATVEDVIAHPERWGDPYDLVVGSPVLPATDLERILAAHPAVEGSFTRKEVEAMVAGQATAIDTYALGGSPERWRYTIPEGRMFAAPGEAVVGQGLLDLLGLEVGDPLRLRVDGKPLDLTIVGRYVEPDNSGQMAMYGLATLRQQVDPTADAGGFALDLAPGVGVQSFLDDLWRNPAITALRTEVPDNGSSEELLLIRVVLAGLNLVLLGIGVVNLLTTTLLGVREGIRDFGILKTLGLTPGQTVWSVASGMGLLAALAALVGIPLGLLVTDALLDELGRRIGIGGGLGIMPGWAAVAVLLPATVLLAVLGSVVPARFAASVRVADVLRYE